MIRILFTLILTVLPLVLSAQERYSLKSCLDYAVENNESLKKDRLSLETSIQSRREVVGALLPQINASGGMTRNIQKTTIAMPNFINSMMPESMRDPDADKYMTVTMGMDLNANWGANLSQQLLNMSLFNAVRITKIVGEMAELGLEISTEDVIAQTAGLYYGIQILSYAVEQFDESISLMDKTLEMIEVNRDVGLVRPIDAKQISVSRTNLETERAAMNNAIEFQKKLLKLQMGFPMEENIEIEPIDVGMLEDMVFSSRIGRYEVTEQLPYKLFQKQQNMLDLQYKSAKFETLPVVTLTANYSMNYMGDDFYRKSCHSFPVSMVTVNMRVPIFSGMSKNAKIKKAHIEQLKAEYDGRMLTQSLNMAYSNALMQLEQNRKAMLTQKENMGLAREVYEVTERNYNEGISSLADLINANSSLIKSKVNYINALNNCIKAHIDLKKADGTITDINH